jgi:FAD-dependent sensor of blue light
MNQGCTPIAGTGKKTKSDLVQLVYVSSAAADLTPADLDAVASRSRARNEAAGLTGLLLHQGPYFYGVLEGERRRLFARMEELITERCHGRLRILREEPIAGRRFRNWSFGTLPDSPEGTVTAPEDFIWNLSRRLK